MYIQIFHNFERFPKCRQWGLYKHPVCVCVNNIFILCKTNITYYIPTVKERDGEKILKRVLHAARNM